MKTLADYIIQETARQQISEGAVKLSLAKKWGVHFTSFYRWCANGDVVVVNDLPYKKLYK
jgi:hypothetical protein